MQIRIWENQDQCQKMKQHKNVKVALDYAYKCSCSKVRQTLFAPGAQISSAGTKVNIHIETKLCSLYNLSLEGVMYTHTTLRMLLHIFQILLHFFADFIYLIVFHSCPLDWNSS